MFTGSSLPVTSYSNTAAVALDIQHRFEPLGDAGR